MSGGGLRRRARRPPLELMSGVAAVVVVVFGLALVAFAGVAFARRETAERFATAFASSARTHYAEQIGRVRVGTALVVRSPVMWQPNVFRLVGWAIVVSSVALLCVPWQWHQRLGERVRPLLVRYLGLYAAGAFAFGALLLYGVWAGGGSREHAGAKAEARSMTRVRVAGFTVSLDGYGAGTNQDLDAGIRVRWVRGVRAGHPCRSPAAGAGTMMGPRHTELS